MSPRSADKTKPSSGTQLLDRSLLILSYLVNSRHSGVRASEVAKALGMSTSTTHRIIVALERYGLVEREEATRKYKPGLTLFTWGARVADKSAFRKICHPALINIAAETGDTVLLIARSGRDAVCVDRQEGVYTIDSLVGRQVGGSVPLGVGPASQLILAHMDPADATAVVDANTKVYQEYNDLTANEVINRFAEIRQHGFALEKDRYVEGLSAIAMPIAPYGRDVIGCLTVHLTTARLTSSKTAHLRGLLAAEIEKIECAIDPFNHI